MGTNYLFIYKRDKPVFIKALSGVVFIFALYRLMQSPLSSIVIALGSIGLFTYQTGIELNTGDRKYRTVTIWGPQSFGSWKDLPELDYISLFKTNITFTTTSLTTAQISQTDTYIQVNLITAGKKKIKVFEGKNIQEAIIVAKKFSKELDLEIWDATIRSADW